MTTPVAGRRVLVVYGTRPEAVKVAPVIRALTASPHFDPVVAVSAQHRSMLDQVNAVFGITADFDLDLHRPGQSLTDITIGALRGVHGVLDRVHPDIVLVQGDTTTAFAAALATFYARIPLAHLEAGLRTDDPGSPFPEEANRRLTSRLAALHLAPTETNRANLLAENVTPATIVVTGNTVVDALAWAIGTLPDRPAPVPRDHQAPVLLVTAHRRESWGEPMRAIARAVASVARAHPRLAVVFPLHANPVVREAVVPVLSGLSNVTLTDPLPYGDFTRLMVRAEVILTDSGGVQEEGAALGKRVLVMRDNTERPEALAAGTTRLVGTTEAGIVKAVGQSLDAPRPDRRDGSNPFGDGRAGERAVAALAHFFGLGPPVDEFRPGAPAITALAG